MGGTNGTYVNGKLTKKHALRDGDVVGIDKHELKYVNEYAAEDAGAAESDTPAAAAVDDPAADGSASSGLPLGKLQVLNGPIAGKELELTKALITLGKPGVQVAVISCRPQGYFLTHIEGDGQNKNYPVVNGTALGPQAYTMSNEDIIELAGIKMVFSVSS